MGGRARPSAFVVAAVIVVAAAAAASLAQPDTGTRERSQPGLVPRPPTVLPAGADREHRSPAVRSPSRGNRHRPETEDLAARAQPNPRSRRGRRRIRAAAETFVAALLRWESGKDGASARRWIRATATSKLARFVLSARARIPLRARRPPEGRIASVEVVRAGGLRALAQVAVRRHGAPDSILLVELVRREGRWLAGALH